MAHYRKIVVDEKTYEYVVGKMGWTMTVKGMKTFDMIDDYNNRNAVRPSDVADKIKEYNQGL
jgi:hypothetical protein